MSWAATAGSGPDDHTYHEYTSAAGGKIFFPASFSLFRKRFRSRKSLLTTSSFSCASQLSSSDAISSASRSFCSAVSFSTHLALSNLGAGSATAAAAVAVKTDAVVGVDVCDASSTSVAGDEDGTVVVGAGFAAVLDGEEKKDVMLAFTFGFLAVEAARSPALRLRGVVMARDW